MSICSQSVMVLTTALGRNKLCMPIMSALGLIILLTKLTKISLLKLYHIKVYTGDYPNIQTHSTAYLPIFVL